MLKVTPAFTLLWLYAERCFIFGVILATKGDLKGSFFPHLLLIIPVKGNQDYSGQILQLFRGFGVRRKLRETLEFCSATMLAFSQPRFRATLCVCCCQIGSTPRGSPLALLIVTICPIFLSPQLRHNIQRTRTHDPGCKHTRGPEVVQQQPRPRDAYELACVWGAAGNFDTQR